MITGNRLALAKTNKTIVMYQNRNNDIIKVTLPVVYKSENDIICL